MTPVDLKMPPRSSTGRQDRKSTRLNSSHGYISYAVFCLKKKKNDGAEGLQQVRPEGNRREVRPGRCETASGRVEVEDLKPHPRQPVGSHASPGQTRCHQC